MPFSVLERVRDRLPAALRGDRELRVERQRDGEYRSVVARPVDVALRRSPPRAPGEAPPVERPELAAPA